ncbi:MULTISPECIES: nicotinate phosphoribosyltransferase [Nocardioides]|uniref:nicotinate phosphoribosyltransferase n=1 Tax=Nocardioides vastitatis TaxID=2568655 RepID=A0ABW0ZI78_9ACTN|nr:nicotinate phosphoribosyltransferase [Nocardioides sp.]THI95903.1 nicotinate phosphoribosyltransferase [Nocardioides sp.]
MVPTAGTGLLTDRYELTMLDSFVRDGSVDRRAVFEAFARRLPEGRRYGMLAGLGRLLALVEDFTFDAGEIAWLREQGVVGDEAAAYLADFRFRGDIDGYREGDLYFPGSPVLTVTGTLGECVVLETLVLSVLNHDTAVASAAARMVDAAGGRSLIEMGGRRTHEVAAIATARAAYLAGFDSTSNLAAGRLHGLPTVGTAAHAFTLAHETEEDAFRSQVEALGVGTTLLVDTYDVAEGIRTAVRVAGPELGGIRLDSGDLAEEAVKARALLDSLGATRTRIVATSDLDEFVISALADAPIDGYGVGTRVATGSGHPTASMVYKLVAIGSLDGDSEQLTPVAKKSKDKASVGGHKRSYREYDDRGLLVAEVFVGQDESEPDGLTRVQVPLLRDGRTVHTPSLAEIRAFAAAVLATLPADARNVAAGPPYLTVTHREEKAVTAETDTKKALIVVDVQNDFVEGGSLGVTGGREVASRISAHLAKHAGDYALVAASRDWHRPGETNGGHFHEPGESPDFTTTWPVHCVQGETGSEYAPELVTDAVTHHVVKGMGVPAYSAFEGVTEDGTMLADLLRDADVERLDITGIATDYCVRATALDAARAGFRVRLLPGLHAGVAEESSAAALSELEAAGVEVGP